ncbi:SigB/SigF/SigG family RNA polymerase sigma factor [Streptomyces sp. UC4497]
MSTRHSHHDAPDTARAFRRLAAAPPGAERDALRAELVNAWLPMAQRLATRYRNKGEDLDDLKQVAAIGLVKSVDRYCPERGAFEAFAVPTITGELRRHFRDHTWDVRVPRRIQDLRNKVRAARRELLDRPGRAGEPGVADISAHTGLTRDEVREGLRALDSYKALSLDAATGTVDGTFSIADSLGETEPRYDLVIRREAAKDGIKSLTERERLILYLRFFEDMPQARIAERIGVSQMHISRLITRSCARVREWSVHAPVN